MKNKPLISIVIPSYNKELYIGETLQSIVDQDYDNYEVIIQDGGSTDGTVDVIKKYAKKYSKKISYVSKKDKGQLDAINKGLKKAKGEILTYINADDAYSKKAFSYIARAYIKNNKPSWMAGMSTLVDGSGREIGGLVTTYKNSLLSINSYKFLQIVNYLMQPAVFFSRDAYKKYGPFTGNNKFVLEYDLWLKMGKDRMPIVINKNITRFRFEPGTISATQSEYLLECDYEIVKKYTSNPFVLLLHQLHNRLRLVVASLV